MSLAPASPALRGALVLKAAYAHLGIPIEFRKYPARRGLAEANDGGADGETIRMGGLSDELPNLIQVEPPIGYVQGVAITCRKDLCITSRDNLKGLRIGVHPGIRLSEILVRDIKQITKGAWDQLFKMLYRDRLDAIIGYDGLELTQKGVPGSERLRVIRPTIWRVPLYHYLNRRHADLVPKISNVLQQLQTSGESERLRNRSLQSVYLNE